MVEGVLGFNDKQEIIISNKMAQNILKILDARFDKLDRQNELTFKSKHNSKNMKLAHAILLLLQVILNKFSLMAEVVL